MHNGNIGWKIFLAISIFFSGQIFCQPISDTLTIVAFGNSTTATRTTIDSVYSQRLPDLLSKFGCTAVVINSGVGGSHTGQLKDNNHHIRKHALDRFEGAVLAHHPDIVIIQFGINDSYVDSDDSLASSRIPLASFRNNLKYMIQSLKDDNVTVILMSPNAFGANKESWRHQRLSLYAEQTRELAKEQQISFIDIYSFFESFGDGTPAARDILLLDGLHPNDLGHSKIVRLIASVIIQL